MAWGAVKVFMRRHGVAFVALLAFGGIILADQSNFPSLVALSGTVGGTQATVFVDPRGGIFAVGQTARLNIRVRSDVPINAVGATLGFDPAALEIVGFSKEDSFFDLWAEETAIHEEAGEIRFSGGTLGRDGFTGTGTLLTLIVRPKREGETIITFTNTAVLAADGRGTSVVHDQQPLVLTILSNTVELTSTTSTNLFASDFNEDGRITAADLYLFAVQMFLPYSDRYDLDRNGAVELIDLRIFIDDAAR